MSDLPRLDDRYEVDEQHVSELRSKGHVTLRGVFSPEEIAAYCPSIEERVLKWKKPTKDAFGQSLDGDAQPLVYTLSDASEPMASFVTSPRLAAIAARLLGVDAVRLLYFSGFFKSVVHSGTPMHQDLAYAQLNTDKMLTIWVALTEVTSEMGALIFAEGSHQQGRMDLDEAAKRFPVVKNSAMREGDASVHMGWTVHGSLKNSTGDMRKALAVIFYEDGTRIDVGGGHPWERVFMKSLFPGLGPGDIAVGPTTPLVFDRRASAA